MTRLKQTGEARQEAGEKLTTVIPIRLRWYGRPALVVAAPNVPRHPQHDGPLLTALAKAFHWQRLLDEGIVASGSEIARREGLHPTTVNELLRLTLLSPALVHAMLAGEPVAPLSLQWLKNQELPWGWDEQAKLIGQVTE